MPPLTARTTRIAPLLHISLERGAAWHSPLGQAGTLVLREEFLKGQRQYHPAHALCWCVVLCVCERALSACVYVSGCVYGARCLVCRCVMLRVSVCMRALPTCCVVCVRRHSLAFRVSGCARARSGAESIQRLGAGELMCHVCACDGIEIEREFSM